VASDGLNAEEGMMVVLLPQAQPIDQEEVEEDHKETHNKVHFVIWVFVNVLSRRIVEASWKRIYYDLFSIEGEDRVIHHDRGKDGNCSVDHFVTVVPDVLISVIYEVKNQVVEDEQAEKHNCRGCFHISKGCLLLYAVGTCVTRT